MSTRQLIAKVWSLCGILRDGGITYQDYLTELSWLLYLQLSSQSASEMRDIQVTHAWPRLLSTQAARFWTFIRNSSAHLHIHLTHSLLKFSWTQDRGSLIQMFLPR